MPPTAIVNPFLHLQRNAERDPRGVFSQSPDQTVTNADAIVWVRKLAYELRRLGVRAGHVVAIDLPDHLGILFAEAVYHEAAISTVIPDGVVAGDAFDVHWVFTSRATTPQPGAQVVTVDARFLRHVEENPYGIRPSEAPVTTLRIAFSSGTTGRPHAIALGRAMEAFMDASIDIWFLGGPTLTLMDTGTAWGFGEFFLTVKAGQPYLCAGGADGAAIARLAERAGVRTIKGSPAQIVALVDALEAQGRTIPSIETVIVAGTVMPAGAAERMRRAADGCLVLGTYGSTEAGGATTRLAESDDPFDAGHVVPGSVVEIVDEDDRPLPTGATGRIRHRSPGMAHGYLGDPAASAAAFRDGWFYPGDLGRFRPDGGLTLTGRESELINAGGVKLDPSMLDLAALRQPGVTDACGFGYDRASGVLGIGLAVVAREDLDTALLLAALRAELGPAAPTLIARVDAVPRNAMGKPMRRTLTDRYREG